MVNDSKNRPRNLLQITVIGAEPAGLTAAIVLARGGRNVLGRDYAQQWRRAILPRLKTGVANRLVFETMRERGHSWALRGLAAPGADPVEQQRRLYSAKGLTRLAYPVAAWRSRHQQNLTTCERADCDCVRCKRRRVAAKASAKTFPSKPQRAGILPVPKQYPTRHAEISPKRIAAPGRQPAPRQFNDRRQNRRQSI